MATRRSRRRPADREARRRWPRGAGALGVVLLTTLPLLASQADVRSASAASPTTIGLQPGDVPGFTPVSPTIQSLANPDDRGLVQSFRQCVAADPLLGQMDTGPAATVSPLYGQGEGPFGSPALMIGTAVFTDGAAADAQRSYALLASPSFQSCWISTLDTITTALTTGLASLGGGATQTALPALSLGKNASSTGFAYHRTFSAFGTTATTTTSVTVILVGAVVTIIVEDATDQTFPETVRASVARAIAARMGAVPPSGGTGSSTTSTSCLRAQIPDPSKPVLTTAQVDRIVRGKARFAGETTSGASVCTWTLREARLAVTEIPATLTWKVAVDGPLSSPKVADNEYLAARRFAPFTVEVTDLGDHAQLIAAQPAPALDVVAGRYFLQFSSATAQGPTETMILHALATQVLVRLGLGSPGATSSVKAKQWPTDWAGPRFCASNDDQPVLTYRVGGKRQDATFRGVAACGEAYTSPSSNLQGAIWYREGDKPTGRKIAEMDATGYQCVEYADRYFYYLTGQRGAWTVGSDVATVLYYTYAKSDPGLGLVPKPKNRAGGTRTFATSLRAGDIVSMWRRGDPTGHVAVVTKVDVHKNSRGKYSGSVTMINENASATGITHITVVTGHLTYDNGFFTTFQWLTGLPS